MTSDPAPGREPWVWTSRREACATLMAQVRPPRDADALRVLTWIADRECVSGLIHIATDEAFEIHVRRWAALSLADLRPSLDDATFDPLVRSSLLEVLGLARGPAQLERATRCLDDLSPHDRAEAVAFAVHHDLPAGEALHARWLLGMRPERPDDVRAVQATSALRASRAWLSASYRRLQATDLRQILLRCGPDERDAFASDPAALDHAARNLALPADRMLRRFGDEGTLRRVFGALRFANHLGILTPQADNALDLLAELRIPDRWWRIMADHPQIGDALASALAERAGREPSGTDRRSRVRAIDEIERRDPGRPGWEAQLAAWSDDPDPAVRIRATGARAVRGDRGAVAALARAAVDEPEVCARAEALTWLGASDPCPHVALLIQRLEDEVAFPPEAPFYRPAVAEAAVALASVPSDPVRTALVRACLRFACDDVAFAIGPALRHVVVSPEPGRLCGRPWRVDWLGR